MIVYVSDKITYYLPIMKQIQTNKMGGIMRQKQRRFRSNVKRQVNMKTFSPSSVESAI